MHRTVLALSLLLAPAALAEGPLAVPAGDEARVPAPAADARGAPLGFDEVRLAEGFFGSTFGATDLTVADVQQLATDAGFRAKPGDDEDQVYAAFLIGGELREGRCFVRPAGNACELGILWQVIDTRTDAVAFEVLSRGFVVDPSGSRTTGKKAAIAAFQDLLARPGFRAVVAGDGPHPAWDGTLHVKACTAPPPALPAELERAMDAGVEIVAGDVRGMGVVVSPDGYVLTAAHVVRGLTKVELHRGAETREARVLRLDGSQDVALLATDPQPACLQVDPGATALGSDLWIVGAPRGDEAFSIMKGVVSATRTVDDVKLLQTDAALNPGDSGGPMLDPKGRVRAIVAKKIAGTAYEGLGFGVPVASALAALGVELGTRSDELTGAGDAPAGPPRTEEASPTRLDAWLAANPMEVDDKKGRKR